MLRVLHFLNLDSVGGVERYFTSLIGQRGEIDVHHGVFVLSRAIHPFLERDVRSRAEGVFAWKRAAGLKLPKWPPAARALWRTRVARKHAPGVALFWNTLGEVDGLAAARRGGLTTVHWERGLAWHRERREESAAAYLAGVDRVLANSFAGKRILQEGRGFRGSVDVHRNVLRADARPSDPRPRRLDPSRPLRLGVAARLVSYKGVSLALHALAELRRRGVDAVLEIAGTGPLDADLREVAARLELGDRARFLGAVEDVGRFHDAQDLLLHPAPCEPCANVLLEAQARGVPVVAALVDGNPELVRDGETGILVPPTLPLSDYPALGGDRSPMPPFVYDPPSDAVVAPRLVDPARLAGAVLELVGDPGRYAAVSVAALARARAAPSAEAATTDLLRWLAGVAAR